MKISEAKEIIKSLEKLSGNLENLRALSTGVMGSMAGKDKAREWSKNIESMANLYTPLPIIFQEAKNVVDNEIGRLNNLIDDTEINP